MARISRLQRCQAPGCPKAATSEVYKAGDKLDGLYCTNCGTRRYRALLKEEHGVAKYRPWDGLLPPDKR